MLARDRELPSFEEWLLGVNSIVLKRFGMSIYEIEDDVPREALRSAFDGGVNPADFVERYVSAFFLTEEDFVD